jgi:hypothetical protein
MGNRGLRLLEGLSMFFSSYRCLMGGFGVFGCFCLFKRVFAVYLGHGKSPWFSDSQFFCVFNPDWLRLNLGDSYGAEFLY